ncbi:MAG: ABC transporter substrate-binding protein [Spirochaetaceae bacterium]|nr:ABC transporter substrate-binding protein [Spirochaetaceae bacterium]
MKKTYFVLVALCVLLFGTGCSKQETVEPQTVAKATIVVKDEFGEVEVPVKPEKVVSLDNRTFETLYNWGVKLVAAPKAVMPATSLYRTDDTILDIGNHREPNLEIIAQVNPDLVIVGQRFAGYYNDIKALVPNAAVISLNIDVSEKSSQPGQSLINGLKENTALLGRIFGKENEAQALAKRFDETVSAVREAYDKTSKVLAVNVSGGEVGFIAPKFGRVWGPWYEVFNWVPALSVDNASTNHKGDAVSLEAIASSNPDYIVVLDRDAGTNKDPNAPGPARDVIENSAVLKNVRAINEGKIVYAPNDTYTNEGIETYIEILESLKTLFSK